MTSSLYTRWVSGVIFPLQERPRHHSAVRRAPVYERFAVVVRQDTAATATGAFALPPTGAAMAPYCKDRFAHGDSSSGGLRY
jgi:hypothetical protein